MKHSVSIVVALVVGGLTAITAAGGCSDSDSHSQAPPLTGTGGAGGTGGETSSTSHGHSSSHASSSHASSSHASSSSAGGAGGGGGSPLPGHCTDMMKDGSETDVDCGGPDCAACGDYKLCTLASDCSSKNCAVTDGMKECQPATCQDRIQNGGESAVDCGGPCPEKCTPGETCNIDGDCDSDLCNAMGKCAAPTCFDHRKNEDETDVDCGGSCPTKCDPGQRCSMASDCGSKVCSGTCQCPQGMVIAPNPNGAYCIDATEVTYSAYAVFYAANEDTASQPSYCSWNTDFAPKGDWPPAPPDVSQPVRFVNWCDANAYCTFVGKRLCGSVLGGSAAAADLFTPAKDQWFNACTLQGNNVYPYADVYNAHACNGLDAGNATPWTTTTMSCQGGEIGLFDMSGNVAEWEDACSGTIDMNDVCPARGGSLDSDAEDLRCDSGGAADLRTRDYTGRDVGFRCCF